MLRSSVFEGLESKTAKGEGIHLPSLIIKYNNSMGKMKEMFIEIRNRGWDMNDESLQRLIEEERRRPNVFKDDEGKLDRDKLAEHEENLRSEGLSS